MTRGGSKYGWYEHAFPKGRCVQAHPATDTWMRGDRYGTVVGYTRSYLHETKVYGVRVFMDRSQRTKTFHPENLIDLTPKDRMPCGCLKNGPVSCIFAESDHV